MGWNCRKFFHISFGFIRFLPFFLHRCCSRDLFCFTILFIHSLIETLLVLSGLCKGLREITLKVLLQRNKHLRWAFAILQRVDKTIFYSQAIKRVNWLEWDSHGTYGGKIFLLGCIQFVRSNRFSTCKSSLQFFRSIHDLAECGLLSLAVWAWLKAAANCDAICCSCTTCRGHCAITARRRLGTRFWKSADNRGVITRPIIIGPTNIIRVGFGVDLTFCWWTVDFILNFSYLANHMTKKFLIELKPIVKLHRCQSNRLPKI